MNVKDEILTTAPRLLETMGKGGPTIILECRYHCHTVDKLRDLMEQAGWSELRGRYVCTVHGRHWVEAEVHVGWNKYDITVFFPELDDGMPRRIETAVLTMTETGYAINGEEMAGA